MGQLLSLPLHSAMEKSEQVEIDEVIERIIALHKDNGAMITRLTMNSVAALTASESRANELGQQRFLKRTWNNLTGKNRKIRAQMDTDLTKVQYASQQMIQKLAEQNLLTFDLVTAVNNKLNTLILDIDEELNQVYNALGTFFKQTRSDLIQLENRIEELERNVELLHWNTTIEYQIYEGVEYSDLSKVEKIVCISNDFFHRSKGEWSTADLMLLKSTLSELGLPIRSLFSSKQFYAELINEPTLITRLFQDISFDGLVNIEIFEAPLIKGVEKIKKINGEEQYVIKTLTAQLEALNVSFVEQELQLSMINHYLIQNASMNSGTEVNMFDFVVELLVNLRMVDQFSVENTESSLISVDTPKENLNRIYDVFLVDGGENKVESAIKIAELKKLDLKEAKALMDAAPTIVLSEATKEAAEEFHQELMKIGADARVKTIIEDYQVIYAGYNGIATFDYEYFKGFRNPFLPWGLKIGDKLKGSQGHIYWNDIIGKMDMSDMLELKDEVSRDELIDQVRYYANADGDDEVQSSIIFHGEGEVVALLVEDPSVVSKGQPLLVMKVWDSSNS